MAPLMDHANFLTTGAAHSGHAAAVLGVVPPVAAPAYDYGALYQQPPANGYQYHEQYPSHQHKAQPAYQATQTPPPPAGRAPQPPAPPPAEEGSGRPQRHSGGMWKVVEA